jgi:N-acetylglucosamine-6-phosphate deacetylase
MSPPVVAASEPRPVVRPPLTVRDGRVLTPSGWRRGDVVVSRGRIARERARGVTRIDASGLSVVPGLIDLQVNGGLGRDFTLEPDSIWEVGMRLVRAGVTAFLPTLISPRRAEVERALGVLAAGPPAGYAGAAPLGVHCAGPMLSPRRRGVHAPSRRRRPSAEVIGGWSPERGVRLVTLAPELPGADRVIRMLVRRGVVVSAGHSDATNEEATRSFSLGVTACTHLFNAMSGLDRREPGLAGAVLDAGGVRAGIVADGLHVHPAMVRLAWLAKRGPAGIVLVSDAAPVVGGPRTPTGGLRRSGGVARTEEGIVAGSLLTLDRAVRNVAAFTGCPVADAIRAASASPAALLRLRGRGVIRPGARGDLTMFDADLRVAATVVGGSVVVDRDGRTG